jgi:hypothetical protein
LSESYLPILKRDIKYPEVDKYLERNQLWEGLSYETDHFFAATLDFQYHRFEGNIQFLIHGIPKEARLIDGVKRTRVESEVLIPPGEWFQIRNVRYGTHPMPEICPYKLRSTQAAKLYEYLVSGERISRKQIETLGKADANAIAKCQKKYTQKVLFIHLDSLG